MWMMMHECRGGIHKRVIEDLMLHQPVHRPHDASHMFVTVFLLTILRQRIQAQQVETETVGTTWKYNDTYEKKIYTTNEFQNPAFSKQAKEAGSEILGPGDEPTEPVTPPTQKKAANPLKIRGKIAIVKYSNLKTKAQALRISDVVTTLKKGKGTLTYAKIFGNKNIIISKKTGKVILKKGLKKGTYEVGVKVKASGTKYYKAGTKTVTFVVKVK